MAGVQTLQAPGGRVSDTPARFFNPRRRRLWSAYAAIAFLFVSGSTIIGWRDCHSFLINTTDSLPNWAFLVDFGRRPNVGEDVVFAPPMSPLLVRHFGPHPTLWTKIVYGQAGDVVTRVGRTYFINGRRVALAKLVTKRGEPLALGPVGVIPRGCYWVGSPHKDGFDSRYALMGWICARRIVGVGTPIL